MNYKIPIWLINLPKLLTKLANQSAIEFCCFIKVSHYTFSHVCKQVTFNCSDQKRRDLAPFLDQCLMPYLR